MYKKYGNTLSQEELENRIEDVRTCKFEPSYP
jgi:hypothetical protein